jgi:hypothetical protein
MEQCGIFKRLQYLGNASRKHIEIPTKGKNIVGRLSAIGVDVSATFSFPIRI